MTQILVGDCSEVLPTLDAHSIQCCVTSPPYWGLRDYGCNGQLGLEATPELYVANMVRVFREVWRVLKDDGTLWLNLGDSYGTGGSGQNFLASAGSTANSTLKDDESFGHIKRAGFKGFHKQLMGIPWRMAFALQSDGWYLRSDIIWHKPNPMPESVTDRPTKSHEYIFLLTKAERYFYDVDAIREASDSSVSLEEYNRIKSNGTWPRGGLTNYAGGLKDAPSVAHPNGRNKRSVWTVATQPYSEAHFATFPEDLIKPCILAGSRLGDTVLDPFAGSGTTGRVAIELGREPILIELNPKYVTMAIDRTNVTPGML